MQAFNFLGRKNITAPLKKGSILSGLFNTEEISCTSASINLLNIDKIILYAEGKAVGTIYMPIIDDIFDNEYTHILNDPSKRYIYGYLISN